MSKINLNDLPELPFEKIIGYLTLDDRIRCRAVSRRWLRVIDSLKVKSLCFSNRQMRFIFKKSHWVNGEFVRNFIGSTRFESFFNAFSSTILSSLKHLRLCELSLREENGQAFSRALSSFDQLEQLGFYRFNYPYSDLRIKLKLNLPMLNSIHFDDFYGFKKVTVTAPRLQNVKFGYCSKHFGLVILPNAESVETLVTASMRYMELGEFKGLKYFFNGPMSGLDDEIFDLEHLEELHVTQNSTVVHGSAYRILNFADKPKALKIFAFGVHLKDKYDPAISSISTECMGEVKFGYLAENYSRLVAPVHFIDYLWYKDIESVATTQLAINVLKRFVDLYKIVISKSVQDIERFLTILKNMDNIVCLRFVGERQPQELYDRLAEHCAVQNLVLWNPPEDLKFVSGLEHLIDLELACKLNAESVLKRFEELPFLSDLSFRSTKGSLVGIRIDQLKRFEVWINHEKRTDCPDLNAAIQFVFKKLEDLPDSSPSN